ncbi:MAG: hypothetical protein MUE49_13365 [Rhodospirillales bacterium]|nr:hypothetical protein [Rhodospirillales bacterium]
MLGTRIGVERAIAVTAFCAAIAMAMPAQAFFAQWTTGTGANNHWYELVLDDTKGWTAARGAAIAKGGYLATITSAGEQGFIVSSFFAVDSGYGSYWIGLSDAATEGTFQWVTGEAFSCANWGGGQPDNNTGVDFGGANGEDYAQFVWRSDGTTPHQGRWNDAREQGYFGYSVGSGLSHLNRKGYLVEYEVTPVPLPAALPLFATAMAGLAWLGYRRKD